MEHENDKKLKKALSNKELAIERANIRAWNYWGRKWRLGRNSELSSSILRRLKIRALTYQRIYSKIVLQLGQLEEKSVLDVGCGSSDYHEWLADDCRRFVGVDISVEMLRLCRDEIGRSKIEVVAADALHLPFKNEAFDACMTFQALHHFPDWKKSLMEMTRVGKQVSLYEPNADSFLHKLLDLIRKVFRSEQRFKEVDEDYSLVEFQASGFSQEELINFLCGEGFIAKAFMFGIAPASLAEKVYKFSPGFLHSILVVEDLVQKIPFVRSQLGNVLIVA